MFRADTDTLVRLLPFPELIKALAAAFVAGANVPLRHSHIIESGTDTGTSLLMPAWDAEGYYGVKIVNIFPGNRAKGLPGLHSTYTLFDARTGAPLALLDGDVITSRRTAAAAALGASYLARPDATRLVVVGAGRVGGLVGPAMAAVRELDDIAVWDIDPDASQRCAQRWRESGLPARAVEQLEPAVREADIVSCATLASQPIIKPEWLAAGSHLDLIGSFTPAMAEAEPACFAQADVWVDTEEALMKSGDLLNAIAAGRWRADALIGNLTQLCRGQIKGRSNDQQRTIFKAVGTALEDLGAAKLAYLGLKNA
ncbi:ornithine cyclodeaminase [Aliidongia dinghuensis]|uniref:Ornithine cyclodeaminase n=1 Tax=Aliidongia dinghuensis TaxID=1867774 RepID=A0A8J2Z0I7_9PROT|nr:ornithine cyclodeaminase family protein [Aliidongia dinghuensis]GGF50646.1 ornithine cyclodeaminase [Aliidongia dinghuensis]